MTDHIKAHWDRQAETCGASHEASWGDTFAINLEIETIAAYLEAGDRVLDAGCGNGFSALRQLERGLRNIVGVDYSEKMIESALAEAEVERDFNRYLKKSQLEDYLSSRELNFEIVPFSSVYYLGSRLLRELVTDASRYPGYTNPINEIFYGIEQDYSGGDLGIQQAFVIERT